MTQRSPFRDFKTSPEIIRLAVMLCVRYPRLLRNVEDPLHERGIEISHETARFWWNRFGRSSSPRPDGTGGAHAVLAPLALASGRVARSMRGLTGCSS
jgi:hypothetical protein